ncbi:MAG: YqeG family HAD IIIA-type phosphatase [Candidatus Eremiobacteraeota bacterium]|nr:YqeG family HAD IIIA-type phosphatase [Candidatus Eremiobacteraeota bacterium]
MLDLLYPDFFMERVEFIDLHHLKEHGYDTLIFDLDNTLVGWRSKEMRPELMEWLKSAKNLGFKMCIVSNCVLRGRVRYFEKLLDIPAIPKAVKPRKKSFIAAIKMLNSRFGRTVVIGDQLFTDVLGGNRLGLLTILVLPVDKREFYATILQRTAEKLILFRMKKKGILHPLKAKIPKKMLQAKEGNL